MSTGDGTKGPRKFDWAVVHQTVLPLHKGYFTTIVARRSLAKPDDIALFSVFAKSDVSLAEMATAIGQRWKIEECFEGAKGEVGLDQYEVRSWHGWHRHMTLALWAYAFLVHCACRERQKKSVDDLDKIEVTVPEVRTLLKFLAWRRLHAIIYIIYWSHWRRRHQYAAETSHWKTYMAQKREIQL